LTTILYFGGVISTTVAEPDLLTGWATVAAAAVAFAAMIVSIVFAVKSGKDASKSADALAKIAAAHQEHAAEEFISLARQVDAIWVEDDDDDVAGFAVRNASGTNSVHDIAMDFPDGQINVALKIRNRVRRQVGTTPVFMMELGPLESSADSLGLVVPLADDSGKDPNVHELRQRIRLRFRDARGSWWERVGNGIPVPTEPNPVTPLVEDD
jgi:hypothetical protein